jgi:hypothetical protein
VHSSTHACTVPLAAQATSDPAKALLRPCLQQGVWPHARSSQSQWHAVATIQHAVQILSPLPVSPQLRFLLQAAPVVQALCARPEGGAMPHSPTCCTWCMHVRVLEATALLPRGHRIGHSHTGRSENILRALLEYNGLAQPLPVVSMQGQHWHCTLLAQHAWHACQYMLSGACMLLRMPQCRRNSAAASMRAAW